MRQKPSWALIALSFALAVTGGVAIRKHQQAERAEARLREVYDGAVLSAQRQMEDMELALSKALLSGEAGAEAQYLNQVGMRAAQVQRSLSLLPLSHTATRNAVKFANQVTDYTNTLLREDALTDQDAEKLSSLISACGACAAALSQARADISAEALAGHTPFYPSSAEEAPVYDSAVSYPTLIYDGPFSDARETGTAKALPDRTVTQEEALALAREFVGGERVLSASPAPEMGGAIPCYGVSLRLTDMTLHAAVTRQGGEILWLSPDTADFAPEKSVEECRENALQFLAAHGYEHMRATYFQAYQGVAVISFAATQGDTLLYPDLVKVQCRMDTAQVVGLEARNYLMNHASRGLLTPRLTEDEARRNVGQRLQVTAAQLCLIPTDSGEKLCYEFQGEYGGRTYLSYINADTGRQEQLLKVIESPTGPEAV